MQTKTSKPNPVTHAQALAVMLGTLAIAFLSIYGRTFG